MKTVLVKHETYYKRNGLSSTRLARAIVQNIVHVYSSNKIRTSSGDVWSVVPCNSNSADFMTSEICS